MGEVHQDIDTVALNGDVGLGTKTMKTVTARFNLDIRYTLKKGFLKNFPNCVVYITLDLLSFVNTDSDYFSGKNVSWMPKYSNPIKYQ